MAPPPGFSLAQFLPLIGLMPVLSEQNGSILVTNTVIGGGEIRSQDEKRLTFREGKWVNPDDAAFFLEADDEAGKEHGYRPLGDM